MSQGIHRQVWKGEAMNFANSMDKRSGLLYPMMLIAAIAVIVISIAGIAMMMGWVPGALSGGGPAAEPEAAPPRAANGTVAACGECGVVESVRATERGVAAAR